MKCQFSVFLVVMVSVGLTALLVGCVSAPSSATTPWVPPSRAQQSDATWKAVRAQGVDFLKPLALAELADVALRGNPATRKAWNNARAAAAQVEQARGYFLPTIVGTFGANRQRTIAEPDDFDLDYTKYGPGLQVNYLVLNFGGGRGAAVEQALQTVYAADFAFNRSIQDVLLAVEKAYYGLISAQSGIKAAQASVKDAQLALDTAKERTAAGVGTALDVLHAQASYDQAQYKLANVKGLLKNARGDLAQVLGLPADTTVNVEPPTIDIPDALTDQDVRRLIDEALNRRPDIAALRATLAAKKAAIRVTGSALWPSLYVNGNVSRNYYDTVTDREFQQNQQNDWSYGAGATLQWTLFDGLQTLSAKRAAAAQADAVKAQLVQAELAASGDVWMFYADYETALEKHNFSLAYLKSTSASYDLALDSFRSGLSSMLDVISAESELAQARMQNITARQDAFTALANLAHATGLLEKGGAIQTKDLFSTSVRKDQP